jgi:hypothetical protein
MLLQPSEVIDLDAIRARPVCDLKISNIFG